MVHLSMADLSSFDLRGRAAAVTGGALGIGAGIAGALVRAGARVVLIDQDLEAARHTAEALNAAVGAGPRGAAASALEADVGVPEEVEDVIERAAAALGSLDVLVNNAGIYPTRSLQDVTPDLFDAVWRTNLSGTLFASRAAARVMGAQSDGGSIINIGSLDGITPSMVGLSMYGASKGGVIALSKHLALELAPLRIRVNVIVPGAIVTEGAARMTETSDMTEEERQEMLAAFEARIPLARLGEPADLGGAAIFLASSASAYVTGAVLPVDGGLQLS
jgi:NAD(P)-dependent dehydrogenase (short-subunit alcohol dehydrogenase family)